MDHGSVGIFAERSQSVKPPTYTSTRRRFEAVLGLDGGVYY